MAYMASVGHPSIADVEFKRLLDYDDSEPQRPGATFQSLTGPTIHQLSSTEESSRRIEATIICNKTNRDNLKLIYQDDSNFICTLQDGEEVYFGYIKNLEFLSNPRTNYYRYRMQFYVTSKRTA